jgi:F-box-like
MYTSPQLPPEIVFLIVDHLEGNQVSLGNASLVCQAWRYQSQQRLFRALTITVRPNSSTVHRLEQLGSTSAVRLRESVEHLTLNLPNHLHLVQATEDWVNAHAGLLARTLKSLPSGKLTVFALSGGAFVFLRSEKAGDPFDQLLWQFFNA